MLGAAVAVAPDVKNSDAFEFLESIVTDGTSGERLDDVRVYRGTTRCEQLRFKVHTPLVGLKRACTNYKFFPLLGYTKVGVDVVELGDYGVAGGAVQSFGMPDPVLPTMRLVKGPYKIDIKYTAKNLPGVVLAQIKHQFDII